MFFRKANVLLLFWKFQNFQVEQATDNHTQLWWWKPFYGPKHWNSHPKPSYYVCMLVCDSRRGLGLMGLMITILVLHAMVMVFFVHQQFQVSLTLLWYHQKYSVRPSVLEWYLAHIIHWFPRDAVRKWVNCFKLSTSWWFSERFSHIKDVWRKSVTLFDTDRLLGFYL